jgi:hypothetical protein
MHTPGRHATRSGPARWFADACDTGSMGSRCTFTAAVAGDAGRAGVDDGAHAGHGDRRLGDVRAQHDAPAAVRLEDAVLLARGQAGVQGRISVSCSWRGRRKSAVSWISRSPTGTRACRPNPAQLVDGVADRLHLVALVRVPSAGRRTGGSGPPRGTCGPVTSTTGRVAADAEVAGEARGVDRGRRDDHLEVGPARQQLAT